MPTLIDDQSGVDADARSDAAVIEAVRTGDPKAFAVLRQRYSGTALAVVRTCTGTEQEAESIASAALDRIEPIIRDGQGPRALLGPFVVWMSKREAEGGTGEISLPADPANPASLARAFTGLPARWQQFLWDVHIMGAPAEQTTATLNASTADPTFVPRDAFMGLRHAYRQAATGLPELTDCRGATKDMAEFVRGTLPSGHTQQIQQHLTACTRCTMKYLCRIDPGTGLQTWLLPVLAGVPLWNDAAEELASQVRAASMTGTVPATDPNAVARPGRGMKSLLGAGMLATAVAVSALALPTEGKPVPAARQVSAEQVAQSNEGTNDVASEAGTAPGPGDEKRQDAAGTGHPAEKTATGNNARATERMPERGHVSINSDTESGLAHGSAAAPGDPGALLTGRAAVSETAGGGDGIAAMYIQAPGTPLVGTAVPVSIVDHVVVAADVPRASPSLVSSAPDPAATVPTSPSPTEVPAPVHSVLVVPSGPAPADTRIEIEEEQQRTSWTADDAVSQSAGDSSARYEWSWREDRNDHGDSLTHWSEHRSPRGDVHHSWGDRNDHGDDRRADSEG